MQIHHYPNLVLTREEKLYQLCFKNRIWTLSNWIILLHLREHEPQNVTELKGSTRVTMGAISEIIKRLEKKGFVSRNVDPDNRRVRLITLTQKGKKIAEEASVLFDSEELYLIHRWLVHKDLSFRGLVLATGLDKCKSLTAGEVAKRFGIKHGNTTLVLDDLTEVGYAIRSERDDRRQKLVSLTVQGEELVSDYLALVS